MLLWSKINDMIDQYAIKKKQYIALFKLNSFKTGFTFFFPIMQISRALEIIIEISPDRH